MKRIKLISFVITIVSLLLVVAPYFVNGQISLLRLKLDQSTKNDLSILKKDKGEWEIVTQGKEPYISTKPLQVARDKNAVILSFEYFCPKGLDRFQIFFGRDIKAVNSKIIRSIGVAEGWVTFSIDLSAELKNWGKLNDQLRLDFGTRPNVQFQIRNIILRKPTEREREIAINKKENERKEAVMDANLKKYLSTKYTSWVTNVKVDENDIVIHGETDLAKGAYLCEVTPYQDVTEQTHFDEPVPLQSKSFEIKFKRYIDKNGFNYDRLLSKWVIVKKIKNDYALISHAHYPDEIQSKYNLPEELPASRKGLGGFSVGRGHLSDLDELNITSVTVNIWFARFMFSKPGPGLIEHVYNGKSYYFREKDVAGFDSTFRLTAKKGIISAAILLVDKAEKCPDPVIGKLLQHPDMDPAGIYSMPNMINAASVDCYAAALDFLAQRYSRPDEKYGRINHWIMHNEVDAGWVWTNMGNKPASVFMDTYIKSMRMCYAIAHKYNPHSKVFVSLTHFWALKSSPQFYPSKELMNILLQYTRDEGDFEWAVALHPYPEDLREPKTWLDKKVDFTFNTPLITFKNLEVIDAWIKLPEVLYKGKIKRTLWLSENGTNSKTYSEEDLKEQAAGFAYAWKKMERLNGIDGFQWHNWIDNRHEGGLRIGLRRFPDDEQDSGDIKPVWLVYKAAGTENEDSVFAPYKKVIGIEYWEDIMHKQKILQ
jgi:hypothetical protein